MTPSKLYIFLIFLLHTGSLAVTTYLTQPDLYFDPYYLEDETDPSPTTNHHRYIRSPSSAYTPGVNMDRGLGPPNKNKTTKKPKSVYPWATVKPYPRPASTEKMLSFQRDGEEPFTQDYYDDYDFEFAKSGIKNYNFEEKFKAYVTKRIAKDKQSE